MGGREYAVPAVSIRRMGSVDGFFRYYGFSVCGLAHAVLHVAAARCHLFLPAGVG